MVRGRFLNRYLQYFRLVHKSKPTGNTLRLPKICSIDGRRLKNFTTDTMGFTTIFSVGSLIKNSLTMVWLVSMTLFSCYQWVAHNSIEANNQTVGSIYGYSSILGLISATRFETSFLGVSFQAQNPLITSSLFCSLVWLMWLRFSVKGCRSGMPIIESVLSRSSFFSWSWQMQLRWPYSADPSDTMAGKAVGYSADSLGEIRLRVRTITRPSYDLLDSKTIGLPPTRTSTSALFPLQTLMNIDRIYSMLSPLNRRTTSGGVATIRV